MSVTVNDNSDRSGGNNYGRTQTPRERPARPITPEAEPEPLQSEPESELEPEPSTPGDTTAAAHDTTTLTGTPSGQDIDASFSGFKKIR